MNTRIEKRNEQIKKLSLVELNNAIRKEAGHIKVLNKRIALLQKRYDRLNKRLNS